MQEQSALDKTKEKNATEGETEVNKEGSVMKNQIRSEKGSNLHLKDSLFELTPDSLKRLKAKRISTRKISFNSKRDIEDDKLRFLGKQIEDQTFLKSLTVDCSAYRFRKITGKGVCYLSESFRSLSSLRDLTLKVSGGQINDIGVSSISKSFRSLPSLQSISLSFGLSNDFTEAGINKLSQGFSLLYHLRTLKLACPNVTDNGLNILIQGFRSFSSSLQDLSLDFSGYSDITDEGMHHLSQSLRSFFSLKSLTLDLRGCNTITDIGIHNISQSFESFPSLHTLSLKFGATSGVTDIIPVITDEGVNYLSKNLRSFLSLQSLSLTFWSCERITDEAVNTLSQIFESLSSLQNLSLDFSSCKITDEGVNYLNQCLRSPSSLKKLTLNFYNCNLITKGAKETLKKSLESIASLQQISISS